MATYADMKQQNPTNSRKMQQVLKEYKRDKENESNNNNNKQRQQQQQQQQQRQKQKKWRRNNKYMGNKQKWHRRPYYSNIRTTHSRRTETEPTRDKHLQQRDNEIRLFPRIYKNMTFKRWQFFAMTWQKKTTQGVENMSWEYKHWKTTNRWNSTSTKTNRWLTYSNTDWTHTTDI